MNPKQRISDEARYLSMSAYEDDARLSGFVRIAGIDEAGRGPLAGPVVAAACILDPAVPVFGVNDSKKLSPARRESLFEAITRQAICYSVARVEPDEIDRIRRT